MAMNAKFTRALFWFLASLCLAALACGGGGSNGDVAKSVNGPTAGQAEAPMPGDGETEAPKVGIAVVQPSETPAPEPTVTPIPTVGPEKVEEIKDEVWFGVPTATAIPTVPPATEPVPPTELPPPTATPTPKPEPSSGEGGHAGAGGIKGLANEIFIGLGGGDGAFCNAAPDGVEFPSMDGHAIAYGEGWICLWGFAPGEEIVIELYDPSGQLVAFRESLVDLESDGVGGIQVTLWLAEQPPGEWFVVAASPSAYLERVFEVLPPEYPRLSVVPPSGADPLGDQWLFCQENRYGARGQATVVGAWFPPGLEVPVGIYHRLSEDWDSPFELVWGEHVVADEEGRWRLPVVLGPEFASGEYYVVAILDPGYEPSPGGMSEKGAIGCFTVE